MSLIIRCKQREWVLRALRGEGQWELFDGIEVVDNGQKRFFKKPIDVRMIGNWIALRDERGLEHIYDLNRSPLNGEEVRQLIQQCECCTSVECAKTRRMAKTDYIVSSVGDSGSVVVPTGVTLVVGPEDTFDVQLPNGAALMTNEQFSVFKNGTYLHEGVAANEWQLVGSDIVLNTAIDPADGSPESLTIFYMTEYDIPQLSLLNREVVQFRISADQSVFPYSLPAGGSIPGQSHISVYWNGQRRLEWDSEFPWSWDKDAAEVIFSNAIPASVGNEQIVELELFYVTNCN